jgi:hypothetical protein
VHTSKNLPVTNKWKQPDFSNMRNNFLGVQEMVTMKPLTFFEGTGNENDVIFSGNDVTVTFSALKTLVLNYT